MVSVTQRLDRIQTISEFALGQFVDQFVAGTTAILAKLIRRVSPKSHSRLASNEWPFGRLTEAPPRMTPLRRGTSFDI